MRVLLLYVIIMFVLLISSFGKAHATNVSACFNFFSIASNGRTAGLLFGGVDLAVCPFNNATPSGPRNNFLPKDTLPYADDFMCMPFASDGIFYEGAGESPNHTTVPKQPLLTVTGNILYDVNYRSRIDTPYAENNIYQHTVQTRLNFLYKQQYPFRLYLTAHFGNSPLFRNYLDVNLHYTRADFIRVMKQKVLQAATSYLLSRNRELDSLKRLIEEKRRSISSLRQTSQGPGIKQRLVEERERTLFGKTQQPALPGGEWNKTDSLKTRLDTATSKEMTALQGKKKIISKTVDSAVGKYSPYEMDISGKRKLLDSLVAGLKTLETLYTQVKSIQDARQEQWRSKIESSRDLSTLQEEMQQLKIPDTVLPKGYKTLYAFQSFSVGRSMVNYSELSVKNVSITGIQAEYNPNYYYSVAAGKVDYRFQDYIVPNHTRSNQYVGLIRFGKGMKDGNHIFLTYYAGKRQFFNAAIASPGIDSIPSYNLSGFTIEGFYKVSKNISLVAEVAKSTGPYLTLDSAQRKNWVHSIVNFKDRSNEAYSVLLNSYFPKTGTRIRGNMNVMGGNFQSFSSFSTGASQKRWQLRLEQPLFKRQLTIISAVQQNDYYNPFVTTTYKSSAVLASLQANLRIRKWPFLSVGYFPSYQLIKMSDDYFSENRYYTLVANAGYNYRMRSTQLSTYFMYSKFYNASADSSFVYFNSENFLVSQYVFLGRFMFQVDGSFSSNIGYNIYTVANSDQIAVNKILTLGGGVKMIRETLDPQLQWGYSANITLNIRRLGSIQFMMDKGFIPGMNRRLVDNKTGRLTYFKTF